MKELLIKSDAVPGKRVKVTPKKIYEEGPNKWVAEVQESVLYKACEELCRDAPNCSLENVVGEADVDDDGKDYRLKII